MVVRLGEYWLGLHYLFGLTPPSCDIIPLNITHVYRVLIQRVIYPSTLLIFQSLQTFFNHNFVQHKSWSIFDIPGYKIWRIFAWGVYLEREQERSLKDYVSSHVKHFSKFPLDLEKLVESRMIVLRDQRVWFWLLEGPTQNNGTPKVRVAPLEENHLLVLIYLSQVA